MVGIWVVDQGWQFHAHYDRSVPALSIGYYRRNYIKQFAEIETTIVTPTGWAFHGLTAGPAGMEGCRMTFLGRGTQPIQDFAGRGVCVGQGRAQGDKDGP